MISPLVNAHTHLEGSWLSGVRPEKPQPFPIWLKRYTRRSRLLKSQPQAEQRQQAQIEKGIEALLAAGTTHVGDITQTGLSIEPLLASGLAGVIYLEIIGLEEGVGEFMFQRAVQMLEHFRPQERHGMRLGLTTHSPYTVPPDVFEMTRDYCLKEDVPLCIHVAEHAAENELLLHGRGELWQLPIRLGGTVHPHVPGKRSIKYLEELGVLDTKPLLIHMVHATEGELDLVAKRGAKIVHCPRSNYLLESGRMPLEKIIERGISVALGTDGLSSSPSLDVRAEAAYAKEIHGKRVTAGQIEELLGNTAVLG